MTKVYKRINCKYTIFPKAKQLPCLIEVLFKAESEIIPKGFLICAKDFLENKNRTNFFNPKHALEFDEESQDRDAERLEGFAVYTNCGMDKKPEGLNAREITVMRKVLMHDLGLNKR